MSITYILQLFDENDDQHFDKYEIIKIMESLSCKFDLLKEEVLKKFVKNKILSKTENIKKNIIKININNNTESQHNDLEDKKDSNFYKN